MTRLLLVFLLVFLTGYKVVAQRACASYEYLQQELKADPLLEKKMAAIDAPRSLHVEGLTGSEGSAVTPLIRIPVVFHLLYNTSDQYISDEQVMSQLEVLNKDFRRLNTDTANTPAVFRDLAADCRIEFVLATADPDGWATTGIIRKQTSIRIFGMDDRIKSSVIGGDNPWDADSYLNIWVGNLPGALVGYASPVGGAKEKDGVVISYRAFGTMGTARAPYNKGRTATHEVGHWLGLRHIWGDRYCGDDYIGDTPPQQTGSYGCPTGTVVTCNNAPYGNMYMNYMDFTYDACINMFTQGQAQKMRGLFTAGGPRYALLSSKAMTENPLPKPVEAPVSPAAQVLVKVFPNPAYNTITIDMGNDEQLIGNMITVHNHLGQLVMQERITKAVMQLNIHSLHEGIYFLRAGTQQKAVKLIKTSVN